MLVVTYLVWRADRKWLRDLEGRERYVHKVGKGKVGFGCEWVPQQVQVDKEVGGRCRCAKMHPNES